MAYIADRGTEQEAAKVYGENWRRSDYKARRSCKAGEICNLYAEIDRLTAKAAHRPRSIGARKARAKTKQARREIRQRQAEINISLSEYRPSRPEYYTAPPAQLV